MLPGWSWWRIFSIYWVPNHSKVLVTWVTKNRSVVSSTCVKGSEDLWSTRPKLVIFGARFYDETFTDKVAFFPANICIAFDKSPLGADSFLIAIREKQGIDGPQLLLERVGELVSKKLGGGYGGVFTFPAEFGPDYYLYSVGAHYGEIPHNANDAYDQRITRWRRRQDYPKIRPARWLFFGKSIRSICCSTSHLSKPFRGRPLVDFMRETGTLTQFEYCKEMHRWDVPPSALEDVREALEESGLILCHLLPNHCESNELAAVSAGHRAAT